MKKILFIKTSAIVKYLVNNPPLGLLYISGTLSNEYFEKRILNMLTPGITVERVKKEIKSYSPDIIAFSSMSYEFDTLIELSAFAKENLDNVLIISGGNLPSMSPKLVMENSEVDIAVIGEGERIFPAPFTDPWSGERYMHILTSRGCPYNCVYCSKPFGRKVRTHSVKRVLKEIDVLYREFSVREFVVIDDIFNIDEKRALDICEGIIALPYSIKLSFPNGLRADLMSRKLVDRLKAAGTYYIAYSIESINPKIIRFIKKELDIEKAEEIIKYTSDSGILTGTYFMFGFPGESRSDIFKNIRYATHSYADLIGFHIATPLPGTEFFNYGISEGYFDKNEYFDSLNRSASFEDGRFRISLLSERELKKILKQAYFMAYSNPARILRLLKKMPKKDIIRKAVNLVRLLIG